MQPTDAVKNLTETSPFPFECHDALPCFTQCCKDVNIYLTPFDLLRLRRATGTKSAVFLSKYTRSFLTKVTNIPVVQLKMEPGSLNCPFVSEDGCRVYRDRPWACRMFPLDLSSTDSHYRIITGGERCLGLCEHRTGTVGDWLKAQGVSEYAEMDGEFQSVIPKGFKPGAPMNEGLGRLLFIAYDLDRFAELLGDSRFAALHDLDEKAREAALENDEELLKLAFHYIRAQMDELYQVV